MDVHGSFELLSPEDVAGVCGLSRRAVYRAISRGELPAARLCHRLRIRAEDLDRWIADRAVVADQSQKPRVPARALRRGSLRAMLDDTTPDLRSSE